MSNHHRRAGKGRCRRGAAGLQGDYSGTCVVCLQPTDTALGFRGTAEWLAARLVVLGLPNEQAIAMVQNVEGDEMMVRVCAACVERCPASFPPPALVLPGRAILTIEQPSPEDDC